MNSMQNYEKITLSPFLRFRNTVYSFPEEPGTYCCRLAVDSGKIIFRHRSYSPDNGAWYEESSISTPRERTLGAGETAEFTFSISLHSGQPDHVTITNGSYRKPAVFTCALEKIDTAE